MAVEFTLLGAVGAGIDGHNVDLGHARQRSVLAALLVDANRLVPVDRLLHRVWADRPPQRARATLSSYVSRLRQALWAAREATLRRRSDGYVLTVDPMAIDLYLFRRLAAEARATEGAPGPALDLFDRALGLWRGDPFAGLGAPWFDAMRAALDAERLAVELDRNDLALAGGRQAQLLAELPGRAEAYPLDERLAGQLMLAWYRSGRQADALHHYERLRRRLADELGADPSPPLRGLHRRILAADPALAGGGAALWGTVQSR
jgi:DNA-binding SARP family transcriptional activator